MKKVYKKSADIAMDELLLKAYREKKALIWDRAERQQPQCGFGRSCLCCTQCADGPCRVSPFDTGAQVTICGKTALQLQAESVMRRFSEGLIGLWQTAGALGVREALCPNALCAADSMLGSGTPEKVGEEAGKLLRAIAEQIPEETRTQEASFGILRPEKPNVLLLGTADCKTVAALQAQAHLNVVSACGSELTHGVPVLTNYASQDAALLTGLIDAVVVGRQCVPPAVYTLAAEQGIAVFAGEIDPAAVAAAAVESAGKNAMRTNCAPVTVEMETVRGVKTLRALMEKAQNGTKGVVFLGGCGGAAHTQDWDVANLAAGYIDEGYFVVTAGCAGMSLAKAGMCSKTYRGGNYPVAAAGLAPAVYIGSCHAAGVFLKAAEGLENTYAVFTELTHNKPYAIAAALAAAGIGCSIADSKLELRPEIACQLEKAGIRVPTAEA